MNRQRWTDRDLILVGGVWLVLGTIFTFPASPLNICPYGALGRIITGLGFEPLWWAVLRR